MTGLVRTDAPCGQTPILRSVCTRDHGSVMRRITIDGRIDILVREEALDSLDSLLFLTHWRPHLSEHWLVSWDGSPIYTGHGRTFLAAGGARQMHLEQLPPDAPDLHPGEGVWHQWKHVARRHRCCWNLTPLRGELRRPIKRLRRKPYVMTACIA